MTGARTSYHHGALREALMDACLHLVETEGIGAVSLRRVAREAGVSPGAPYHHFADRAALLAALATRGFELLAADLAAARDRADTPAAALTALARAYVDFARRRPGYFRLMFRPELSEPDRNPELHAAADVGLRVAGDVVADCVRAGALPAEQADILTIAFWGLGHGIASLWLDGQLDKKAAGMAVTPEQLTERIMNLVVSLLVTS